MVFIAAHVIFVTVVQTMFDRYIQKKTNRVSLFDNFINGIANIYFPNQINQYTQSGKQQIKGLDFGQLLFMEFVILLENTVMLIAVIVSFQNNGLAIGLKVGSFVFYILGLALKMVYYKFFYIWKNVLWTDVKQLKQAVVKMHNSTSQTKDDEVVEDVEETMC